MNKVLIIDASESNGRLMSGLLTRAGYDPVVAESIEAGKVEAAKLPPGAVIVAAMRLPDGTAKELINWLTEKAFRPNLFFMLRQSDIAVPSLKETPEDIPVIADFFLKRYAAQTGQPRKHLDASAIKALKLYPWPGNVRELKDIVLFAAFHAKEDKITKYDITFSLSEPLTVNELHLKNEEWEKLKLLFTAVQSRQ